MTRMISSRALSDPRRAIDKMTIRLTGASYKMTRPDVKMNDEMTRHYSALSLAGAAQNLSFLSFP
jgi:hypothetical protein